MSNAKITVVMKDRTRPRRSFELDAKQMAKIINVGKAHGVNGAAQIVYEEELLTILSLHEIDAASVKMAELTIDGKSAFVWYKTSRPKGWDRYVGNGK